MGNTESYCRKSNSDPEICPSLLLGIKKPVVPPPTNVRPFSPPFLLLNSMGEALANRAILMACLLHIYSTCAREIVRKVYKVERLIGKMLERVASFLSFSGNMKNGGNMEKWIQPWTKISCGCSSKMQHERKGTNLRIIIWEMNIYEFS